MAFWPFTQPWYDSREDLRRRYAETVIYNDGYKIDFMAQKPTTEAWNGTLIKQEKDENPQDTCKDRDLIFKENSTSALLRLPQELKDRIYELACGGELLHISYRPPENKFYNYICQAPVSDQQVYEDFSTAKGCWNPLLSKVDLRISKNPTGQWKSSESVYQHENCLEMRTGGLLLGLPSLSLSLLRVCRQTYHEARLVPISKNTFAFEDPYILWRFITRISSIHERNIRSVQLDIMLDSARVKEAWKSAVFFVIVSRLRNLRNVDICIDLADYHTLIPDDRVSDPHDGAWMSDLLSLRHLPLKNAAVIIRDKENGLTARPNIRWPLEQKQRWARFIRDRILRLDGVVSDDDDKVNGNHSDEDSDEEWLDKDRLRKSAIE